MGTPHGTVLVYGEHDSGKGKVMSAPVTTMERVATEQREEMLRRIGEACGCDARQWDRVVVAGANRYSVFACGTCAAAKRDAFKGFRVTVRALAGPVRRVL